MGRLSASGSERLPAPHRRRPGRPAACASTMVRTMAARGRSRPRRGSSSAHRLSTGHRGARMDSGCQRAEDAGPWRGGSDSGGQRQTVTAAAAGGRERQGRRPRPDRGRLRPPPLPRPQPGGGGGRRRRRKERGPFSPPCGSTMPTRPGDGRRAVGVPPPSSTKGGARARARGKNATHKKHTQGQPRCHTAHGTSHTAHGTHHTAHGARHTAHGARRRRLARGGVRASARRRRVRVAVSATAIDTHAPEGPAATHPPTKKKRKKKGRDTHAHASAAAARRCVGAGPLHLYPLRRRPVRGRRGARDKGGCPPTARAHSTLSDDRAREGGRGVGAPRPQDGPATSTPSSVAGGSPAA